MTILIVLIPLGLALTVAPAALVEAVRTHRADYGVALDGDADRLQIVDAGGRLYNGDELLYLMVQERLSRGEEVPGAVGTLMTNMAVELALAAAALLGWLFRAPELPH